MHTAHFYWLIALVAPPLLAGASRASGYRWGATATAGVYTAVLLLMEWILPLFPAEPKLGPVYWRVTHFVPPEFPMLLVIPAFVMDLIGSRKVHWSNFRQAAISGLAFIGVFALVQWPFADFLMSPWSRNWFFGTQHFGYYAGPTSLFRNYIYYPAEAGGALWREVGLTILTVVITTFMGLRSGDWAQRLRR
jgi:hypothetical protein